MKKMKKKKRKKEKKEAIKDPTMKTFGHCWPVNV